MTAVEFLERQYNFNKQLFLNDFIQAKEMEKEQIEKERLEAYNNGYANGQKDAYTE